MPERRRKFTPEFKDEAVKLVVDPVDAVRRYEPFKGIRRAFLKAQILALNKPAERAACVRQ